MQPVLIRMTKLCIVTQILVLRVQIAKLCETSASRSRDHFVISEDLAML